jgi:hypothetical protein
MASKIQFRRGLAASWTTINPILSAGEPGVETDTGKMKIGDGSTPWVDLEYLVGEAVGGGVVAPGSITNTHIATNAAISADKLADGGSTVVMTTAERAKLGGIATGATLNSSDAYLLARSHHTGEQPISSIIDLESTLAGLAGSDEIASQISLAVANTPKYHIHSGVGTALSGYPTRDATTRPVHWFGPAAAGLPTNGTTAGGTRAAVSGLDIISEY